MTRRQALSEALRLLSADAKNKDICIALEELRQELPMAHWTQASVLDAVQDYLCAHGCLPKPAEMNSQMGLPSHMTVRKLFHMTLLEFEQAYFPEYLHRCESRVYHRRDSRYWLENFKRQYVGLGCPSAETYEREREEGTPGIAHLKKLTGAGAWEELITMCGLGKSGRAGFGENRGKAAQHPKPEATVRRNEALGPEERKALADDLENLLVKACGTL